MLFDGTPASLARWAQAGPGRFELQGDCTLVTAGGLGLLWYDDEPFDSPLTLKVEWRLPGDANSGVFLGFPAVGNDPFVAVERGYEVQIDPTDGPSATTGAIYSFRAADQSRRDRALRPAGEWNTYELTVDAPRIVVRLNGVVVNRFTSTSPARRTLAHGFVGLQNHSDADRVSFRSVQVKEWGGARPRCSSSARRAPSDSFAGTRLDGCRWNRLVRHDGGGLHVGGGALHVELADTVEPGNLVLQRAPAGAWTIETTVRVPLRSGSQQAGLLAHRAGGGSVRLVAAAGGDRVQLRLVGTDGTAVAVTRPRDDTYRLRLTRSGPRYTGWWRVSGGSWRRLGSLVERRAPRAYGLLALGPGLNGAPPYASFAHFRVVRAS
jgi:hypothetical protein